MITTYDPEFAVWADFIFQNDAWCTSGRAGTAYCGWRSIHGRILIRSSTAGATSPYIVNRNERCQSQLRASLRPKYNKM